jgi:hypothetical protein
MTSVELLTTEVGRLTTQVGRIDFYALPVQKEIDFMMVPAGIVSLDEVQVIANELSRGGTLGRAGRYAWRKNS